MHTPWGYDVDVLPDLISVKDFDLLTGNAFAGRDGVELVLSAVSQMVRDYCGWHISPNLPCGTEATAEGRFVALPTMCLTSVDSIEDGGEELSEGEYEYMRNGLVRRCCFRSFTSRWGGVKVRFHSGFDYEPALAGVVAQIAANSLAAPQGIASERTGNVEVEYNRTGDGITGGITILPREEMVLQSYRLKAMP